MGAETRGQGARTDLGFADHGEGSTTAAETELGETGNWRVVVANRRQERMLGLGDDPTQQTMPSIYSGAKRWPVNLVKTRGGRKEGMSHQHVLPWHSPVEELRRSSARWCG
jgi:hypothetical protein